MCATRWCARTRDSLDELPQGARVGSASLRREALLRRARPDLRIELLRGNVPTRVAKVESGELDATLLAAAGLKRIGLEDKIAALLPLEQFPPACGQGTIAIECRADDARIRDLPRARSTIATHRWRSPASAPSSRRSTARARRRSPATPASRREMLRFDGVMLSEDGSESYEASGSGAPPTPK